MIKLYKDFLYEYVQPQDEDDEDNFEYEDENDIIDKLRKITLEGEFYHGSSIDDNNEIIRKVKFGYSDYNAFWMSSDENIAQEFSDWHSSEGEVRCVYKLHLNKTDDIAEISESEAEQLKDFYGYFDFRECIDILKDSGYDGWMTVGSIGGDVYDDYAIFRTNLIYIQEIKFLVDDEWTEFMSLDEGEEYLKTKIRKNDENEI